MTLHPADAKSMAETKQDTEKMIFAPAGSKSNSQAEQYTKGTLSLSQLDARSPLRQFHTWFTHAQASAVHQPETVCLATASLPSGRVSSRMVYLKELDARGFVVYSNWGTSQKARDVLGGAEEDGEERGHPGNPWASLTFWWRELERQVRVEGRCERLAAAESQVYFDTRARGSRVGAWASRQSEPLPGGERRALEDRVDEVERRFEGAERIPVPEFWGGVRIVPERVEFWQGRESRLHDRFVYIKNGVGDGDAGTDETLRGDGNGQGDNNEGSWTIERLNP